MKKTLPVFILLLIQFYVLKLSHAQVIAGGGAHSISLCNDGKVMAWGRNAAWQLGDGTNVPKSTPVNVSNLIGITAITSSKNSPNVEDSQSLALKSDSTLWSWGSSTYGKLGHAPTPDNKPGQVDNLSEVISAAAGSNHSLALKKDSSVWTWGLGTSGQLGNGVLAQQNIPTKVNNLSGIISIAGGDNYSLALKDNGTVWTWGKNSNGQLGDGTTTQKNFPVKLNSLSGIIAISAGLWHSVALKSDGTVWTWGLNSNGQLGDGSTVQKTSPVQITGLSGIIAIACGSNHTIALKNDGTLWAFGRNADGQIGDGTLINRTTPVQITTLTDVTAISAGESHSIALTNNGTLWTWGRNNHGQLGDGTTTNKKLPVQIGGTCSITTGLMASTSQTNACNGGNNASATITAYNGLPPYSYLWNNGITSSTATNLSEGSYSIVTTDANGDTATRFVTIIHVPFAKTITQNSVNCYGKNTGSVDLTVNGGSGNYSYMWSNGSTTEDISNLFANTYTINIVDITCNETIIDSIHINQPDSLTTTLIYSSLTCGNNNGSASANVNGGTQPYSYLWNTGSTSAAINNLTAGSYNLKVTDANGCIDSANVAIALQSTAVISNISSQTNVLCNLSNNGSATVTASGGTPGYTYAWSTAPVQTTSTAIGLTEGTYTVTISDTNGCVSSNTANITVLQPINVIAHATSTVSHPGTSVTLTASGTSTYAWNNGIVNGVPFIPSSTTNYIVTGTDGSGCYNKDTITITIIENNKTLSSGGLFSLAVCTNGIPMSWGDNTYGQLGDGTTVQKNAPIQLNNTTDIAQIAGGYYHSLLLKNNGTVWACGVNNNGELGDGTNIDKSNPVQVLGLTGVIAIAAGRSHSLALKNDGTVWAFGLNNSGQIGDGTLINKQIPIQVIGVTNIVAIAAGYNHSLALKNDGTVWAWGDNGWGQLGTNLTGVIKNPQIINNLSNIIAITGGENHTLALKDNGTVWALGINNNGELGNGTNSFSYNPVNVTGLTNIIAIEAGMGHSLALKNDGTLWAWGVNGWGQLGNGNTINSNIPQQVVNLTGVNAIAAGGAHSLAQKNDGSVWTWGLNLTGQIGDGSFVANRPIPVQTTITCPVSSALTVTISQTNNTCLTNATGTATANASGGIIPYSYLWNNGMTTATISNLTSGTYTVTITDAINNTSTHIVTINGGVQILSAIINPSCVGENDGIISLYTSGGGGNFIYEWSNGASTGTLNGLTQGNYTVNVIDGICADTVTSVINVNDPQPITGTITPTPATCGNNNGSASVMASGGTPPYSYLWSTGDTTLLTPSNLAQGNYSILITDINGCNFIDSTQIIQQYAPVSSQITSQTNVICNGDSTGSATVTPIGGTPTYSFLWSTLPTQTTQTANNLSAGEYTVKVTDSNGCIHYDSLTISQPPPVPVIANSTATVIFLGHSITLIGGGASVYIWTGGVSDGIAFIPTTTNTYTVTGTDGNGCSNTSTVTITVKRKHRLVAGSNLAVCNDGNIMNWTNTSTLATYVSSINDITDVETGQFHSLALKNDGTVFAWGQNGSGCLGNGTTTTDYTPSQVLNLTNIVDIAAGNDHSLALKNDGTIWAWGANNNGQLGDSTLIQRLTPVQVNALTGIIEISAGLNHSIALKDDGTVWSWGDNSNGQLGIGVYTNKIAPIQVIGLTDVKSISTCGSHCLALKNDGTVWAWGASSYGQLGNGSATLSSIPVQVNTIVEIIEISAGKDHSIALKNDGTVFGWGSNSNNQLLSNVSYHTNPIQLTNYSNAVAIASGYNRTLVLINDGTLWTTSNGETQIGDLCPIFIDPYVWPGDTDHNHIVNNNDLLPIGLYYANTGIPRTNGLSNLWQPYPSSDWATLQNNGYDIKHSDCNGDGLINIDDTLAIHLNYNQSHTITPPVLNNDDYNRQGAPIYIISNNSYNSGDWVNAEVWLGDSYNHVSNLYGIAFNIHYDASLVEPGTESIKFPQNSFLGTIGTDAIKIGKTDPLATIAHGALTRIDHTNRNGYGKIADFQFKLKTSLPINSIMSLFISNNTANNAAGVPQIFQIQSDSIFINQTANMREIKNTSAISVYPNPFNNQTTITFSIEQKNCLINIKDVLGKTLKTINFSGKEFVFDREELNKGIYFVETIDDKKNSAIQKIIIQ
jgi:alpha-tubulin suppressor-like RCC1 family protein